MASTWHALTLRVSLRLARRPSTQFANSTTSVQRPLQVFNVYDKCSTKYKISTYKTLFQASEATALLQVKQGYWSYKPLSWRTYKIRRQDFVPTICSTRENKEITTDKLCTRTTSHVSSTMNSLFFGSRVAGFASNLSCLKYLLLRLFFYKEAICKGSTGKGLPYAPYPDNCEKGTLSDQPRLSHVSSTALLCCWGHSCSKI